MKWVKNIDCNIRHEIERFVRRIKNINVPTDKLSEYIENKYSGIILGIGSTCYVFDIKGYAIKYIHSEAKNNLFGDNIYPHQSNVCINYKQDSDILLAMGKKTYLPVLYGYERNIIVMEKVTGNTLEDLIYREKLEVETLKEIGNKIIYIFTEFINKGILPTDVFFDNIYICNNNEVKILDFNRFVKINEIKNRYLFIDFKKPPEQLAKEYWYKLAMFEMSEYSLYLFGILSPEYYRKSCSLASALIV
ncbi:MAG: Protein kinase domain [Clostridiaceae bacterium]|nr:Protein kinase domain [Clostridiaceae bacterium]